MTAAAPATRKSIGCARSSAPAAWPASEVGYSEAEWTAVEVACNMAFERQFFTDHGFDLVSGYQLNDGPEPDSPERYGFRRLDGTWKPVASTFPSPPRL